MINKKGVFDFIWPVLIIVILIVVLIFESSTVQMGPSQNYINCRQPKIGCYNSITKTGRCITPGTPCCGDEILQGSEQCEPGPNGQIYKIKQLTTCSSLNQGFKSGYLTCNTNTCTLNTNFCEK